MDMMTCKCGHTKSSHINGRECVTKWGDCKCNRFRPRPPRAAGHLAALIIAFGAACAAVGCEVQQDTQEVSSPAISAALVGTWTSPSMTLALLPNGAYVMIPPDGAGFTNGTWNATSAMVDLGGNGGTYSLSGSTLTMTFNVGYGVVTFMRSQTYR